MNEVRKTMLLELFKKASAEQLKRWGVEYKATYSRTTAWDFSKEREDVVVNTEVSDSGNEYFCCYKLPDWSMEEIAFFQNEVNAERLGAIEKKCGKLHFWVKFWSIWALISMAISLILTLASISQTY